MDIVKEKSSCTIYATVKDSAGAAIPVSSIATFEATLYLKDSAGTILNSRNAVNLRGVAGDWPIVSGMKATILETGRAEIFLSSLDNALSVATAASEIHVLMVHFVTTGSLPQVANEIIEFEVKNLLKVT